MSSTITQPATHTEMAAGTERPKRPTWIRVGVWLLIVAYAAFWGVTGLVNINVTDFDVFFLPSAIIAAGGHPLHIYTVRYLIIYPNANGPLAIGPLALVAWLAAHLGWLANRPLRRALAQTVFSVFALLMAREAVLASDRLLSRPLRTWRRLLAYALFALSPELWHSVLFYGHLEQPLMLWLVLAGVRALVERRTRKAGLLLGFALLTRSAALVYLMPLAVLLCWRRRWREAARLLGAAGATIIAGLLPFCLAGWRDVSYSLMTFRDSLPIGGGTIWRLALHTHWQDVATRYDSLAALLATALLTVLLLATRRDLDIDSPGVYALLGASSLCFTLLMRTLWPYYFLDAYVFLGIWWLSALPRVRSRLTLARWLPGALVPALIVVWAQIAEYEVNAMNNGPWDVRSSLTLSALVAATLVGVLVWVGLSDLTPQLPSHSRGKGEPEPQPAGRAPLPPVREGDRG